MGFRKQSYIADSFRERISEYHSASTEKDKYKKKLAIQDSSLYPKLIKNAATNLNKAVSTISFDEAIQHGLTDAITDKANQEFGEFLAKNKVVTELDCYTFSMQGMMYLPAESIKSLKNKFLESRTPIGSNTFFSTECAMKTVENSALKALVLQKKLSPSNAIEIERKMTSKDPRLEFLLSPIGLEMMERNHISGWYIGVYFQDIDYVKLIISEESLNAFQKSFIKMKQLATLAPAFGMQLLSSFGLQALYDGEISISEFDSCLYDKACIKDKAGNIFSSAEDLRAFLQARHSACANVVSENIVVNQR
jgi:hypothetical protein